MCGLAQPSVWVSHICTLQSVDACGFEKYRRLKWCVVLRSLVCESHICTLYSVAACGFEKYRRLRWCVVLRSLVWVPHISHMYSLFCCCSAWVQQSGHVPCCVQRYVVQDALDDVCVCVFLRVCVCVCVRAHTLLYRSKGYTHARTLFAAAVLELSLSLSLSTRRMAMHSKAQCILRSKTWRAARFHTLMDNGAVYSVWRVTIVSHKKKSIQCPALFVQERFANNIFHISETMSSPACAGAGRIYVTDIIFLKQCPALLVQEQVVFTSRASYFWNNVQPCLCRSGSYSHCKHHFSETMTSPACAGVGRIHIAYITFLKQCPALFVRKCVVAQGLCVQKCQAILLVFRSKANRL